MTIRFFITRDRIETETRKWCQTACLVKQLRKICILTYLGHDLTLTWGQILKSTLHGQKVNVPNQLDEANTMIIIFIFVSYQKPISVKTVTFHLLTSGAKTIELRSNLIEVPYRGMKRAPQCFFFRIFPSYHTFGDNSTCFRNKTNIFSVFNFW